MPIKTDSSTVSLILPASGGSSRPPVQTNIYTVKCRHACEINSKVTKYTKDVEKETIHLC